MATASPINVQRVPGRLVLTPTSLAGSHPFGGTELGVTRDNEFRIGSNYHEEQAEEWGGTARVLDCGGTGVFACILRSWDNDALSLLQSTVGTVTQDRYLLDDVNLDASRAGTPVAGSLIMWSPVATETGTCLILYNAVPMWDEAAKLQFSIKAEMAPALMFACLPDANGRTYFAGKIADGSL